VHMRKTTIAALQRKYLQLVLTFRIGLVDGESSLLDAPHRLEMKMDERM
jgi:hypothetical protein